MDRLLRKAVRQNDVKRHCLRAMLRNQESSPFVRHYIQNRSQAFFRTAVPSKVRNRCIITDRARSVETRYRISRFYLKHYGERHLLPGFHKSSW